MLLDYLKTFEFRKPTLSEYKTSSGYRNESWKDLEKEKCLKNNPFFKPQELRQVTTKLHGQSCLAKRKTIDHFQASSP